MYSALVEHRTAKPLDLAYFVEWHRWLWKPAVRAVIGDARRFAGRRVLELGCGNGRMTCLFGLLGAQVTGLEVPGWRSLDSARSEVEKWNLQKQVSVRYYNGDLAGLDERDYDYVFSKSVLVMIPDLTEFLAGVAMVLRPDGRLLAVENLQRGTTLRKFKKRVVRLLTTRRWDANCYANFHGVTPVFLDRLRQRFDVVRYQEPFGLVAAIEACKRSPDLSTSGTATSRDFRAS